MFEKLIKTVLELTHKKGEIEFDKDYLQNKRFVGVMSKRCQ